MSVTHPPQELCRSPRLLIAKPLGRVAALRTRRAEPHGAPLGRHATRRPSLEPLAPPRCARALPKRPASLAAAVQLLLSSRTARRELLLARAISSPAIVLLGSFVAGDGALHKPIDDDAQGHAMHAPSQKRQAQLHDGMKREWPTCSS